jgi:uncharacterized protein Veg
MTISQIKQELNDHIGEKITLKYDLGRNKHEEYNVVIKELYNNVFLVQLEDKDEVKSFSYSDIITNTLKVRY